MTLEELLATVHWPAVQAALMRTYPWQRKGRARYRKILRTLRAMQAEPVPMRILIEMRYSLEPDEEPEPDVSGVNGTLERDSPLCSPADRDTDWGRREVRYGLSLTPWREWLGMSIDPETLRNFRPAQVVACVLWEMTWYGFTEAKILERFKKWMGTSEEGSSAPS